MNLQKKIQNKPRNLNSKPSVSGFELKRRSNGAKRMPDASRAQRSEVCDDVVP